MRLLNDHLTDDERSLYEAFQVWLDRYHAGDVRGILAPMDREHLSVGTGKDEVSYDRKVVEAGFERDFDELGSMDFLDGEVFVRVWDDTGLVFFQGVYDMVIRGEDLKEHARRTLVYHRREGRWILIHSHHSVPDRQQLEARSFPVGQVTAAHYLLLFSSSRDAIVLAGQKSGAVLEANLAALSLYGRSESQMLDSCLSDLMDDVAFEDFRRQIDSCPSEGALFESVHLSPGGPIPVEVSARVTELDGRSVVLLVVRDISSRVATEEALRRSEERLRLALEANRDGLWELIVPEMTVFVTGPWCGRGQDRIPYDHWREIVHPEDRTLLDSALRRHLQSGGEFGHEYRVRRRNGRWRWVLERGRVVEWDRDGRPLRMLGTVIDVDRRKRVEEERKRLTSQLEELASTDKLTGILNRQRFEAILQQKMAHTSIRLALIMFDLDHFKDLNDACGHNAGDEALVLVSRTVKTRLGSSDLFCRWGGDEFMVALTRGESQAVLIAEDLRRVLQDVCSSRGVPVTASFGVALWDGRMSLEQLSYRADQAMYRAKRSGRGRVVVFDEPEYN